MNFAVRGSQILLPAVRSSRRGKPSRKIALNSNGKVNYRELARRPWSLYNFHAEFCIIDWRRAVPWGFYQWFPPIRTSKISFKTNVGAKIRRKNPGPEKYNSLYFLILKRLAMIYKKIRKRKVVVGLPGSTPILEVPRSGVASIGARGGRVPPLTAKICQNRKKQEKIRKKEEKSGKNREKRGKIGKNQEKIGKKEEKSGRFFHFAPPDRKGWLRYWCCVVYVGTVKPQGGQEGGLDS